MKSVARYLKQLDSADRQEPTDAITMRKTRLNEKLDKLREEMRRLKALEKQRLESEDGQISLSDPDARSMATSGRGSGVVGYNVQAAVDTENHLIVAHDVVTTGSDREQLSRMSKAAKDALKRETIDVVAASHEASAVVTLPKPQTSGAGAAGRFAKADFRYVPEEDAYICPAGQRLSRRMESVENGLTLHRYWTTVCERCSIRDHCTTGKEAA